ncbi:hypothetical protein NHH03_06925 [Stieleria sp. TO1_6]|uniref:hypothetical protein n=1 Tax=Stieleria tagensis TaxID=2956795 RepID=UPI00209BA927|nr:hypothetical protein [Stieleria tagensis]MCO8121464.1 hypothetical protein [Stieleria tagensis]
MDAELLEKQADLFAEMAQANRELAGRVRMLVRTKQQYRYCELLLETTDGLRALSHQYRTMVAIQSQFSSGENAEDLIEI